MAAMAAPGIAPNVKPQKLLVRLPKKASVGFAPASHAIAALTIVVIAIPGSASAVAVAM